jgi:hypothetical protein
MPKRTSRRPESPGNTGGTAPREQRVGAPDPMRDFNDLARKLVNVPREELRREQELYDAANAARRSHRKRRASSC